MVYRMTDLQISPSAQLVGSTEACEELGISRSTLTRWLANGWIAAVEQLASGAYVFAAAEVARVKTERPGPHKPGHPRST
jgi:hypothetical protein